MKKFIITALTAVALLTTAGIARAAPQVVLNDREIAFDVPPVIEQGRTLVPLRAIFEALGAEVKWDATTQSVVATKDGTEIKLVIGGQAYKNGQPVALDVPAKIMSGRTMVPLRFVSEALGASVYWEDDTQTVTIYGSGEQPDEATFKEYLSDMDLGRLPPNGQLPNDIQQGVHVLAPGDQISIYFTLIKEAQISYMIYDVTNQKAIGQKHGFPKPLPPSGYAGTDPINLSPGDYEYKVYVGDVFVKVLPFQIRLNPVT